MPKKFGTPTHKVCSDYQRRVKLYKGCGLTNEQIATILQINCDTLVKYYKKELDEGLLETITQVASKGIIQPALKGNVSAAIFYLKCRAKWRDNVDEAQAQPTINIFSAPLEADQKIESWVEKQKQKQLEKEAKKKAKKEGSA